jgi:hypothetical protein
MELLITASGGIRCLYAETIDLAELGTLTIRRASFVEPNAHGRWTADLYPLDGPKLGPFSTRRQALSAEEAWLRAHWLVGDPS